MLRTHYVADLPEGEATIAGWAHEIRQFGKLTFIILRDRSGLIQITLKAGESPEAVFEVAKQIVKETAIVCKGRAAKSKVAKLGMEFYPSDIQIVGQVHRQVPFELTGKVPADLDVRLNNRFVDLRRPEVQAIFKIRSQVLKSFRASLDLQGFQEINPPSIVSSATEGGTDLFAIKYFEKEAFLAQSPQLYKQLAVQGGMDKVFMVAPVWRAEKHNTTQHLNEVTQMDAEMGFADDSDAMDSLEKTFIAILFDVKRLCEKELLLLEAKFTVPDSIPRHTYSGLVSMLEKTGVEMRWGDDFSKENEGKLLELLKEECFFITDWPTQARAFYSLPHEENAKTCKAYDLVFKGLEMASGAQRIHVPELLIKQLKSKGLDPANFESYIDSFRYGAIPHAGWSIGCDRLVMQLCGLSNIREASMFPRDRHRLTP